MLILDVRCSFVLLSLAPVYLLDRLIILVLLCSLYQVTIFPEGATLSRQIEIAILILYHTLYLKNCVTQQLPVVGGKRPITFLSEWSPDISLTGILYFLCADRRSSSNLLN